MTEEERELVDERNKATVPVILIAILVGFLALFKRTDPMAPFIGFIAALWGGFLLLLYRYTWPLLISALVMVLGGISLLYKGGGQ